MKIDDAIIDKVLNNEASVEEAGLVAEWFATEEGSEYLPDEAFPHPFFRHRMV